MMKKIPVSVIVMTKNEEKNIAKCLDGVKNFNEVFVVDSGSTDATCVIAEKKGAIVKTFKWNGKYPKKKQWCLENLPFSNDWVLYVDADEFVTDDLIDEIAGLMSNEDKNNGYFIGLTNIFLNKVLKYGHKVYKLVLLDRTRAKFPYREDEFSAENMWEVEGHYQPNVDGSTGKLKFGMLHQENDTLYHYFSRHNRYSDWEAHKNLSGKPLDESVLGTRGVQKRIFQSIPRGKWILAFLHCYFLKLGFLDGRTGFHYALARAFYYWQIELKTLEFMNRAGK